MLFNRFEWDENKNIINLKKHGIDFETASKVFFDDNLIEYYDRKNSLFEDRYIAIGSIDGYITVLVVAYTDRYNRIRIISARYANLKERRRYYDSLC